MWLRVGDVAVLLGVSPNTVRRWTDVGRIAAHRSPGGHRRYLSDDVLALAAGEFAEGAAHPGDFAQLRRESHDLRSGLHAGLDLVSLLADDPHAVPGEAARMLCELTGAPRCDVYLVADDRLELAVSMEGGELDPGHRGETWPAADWVPVDGDPSQAGIECMQVTDTWVGRRGRLAMQRRGCRSLAWAPMVLHGSFVGAIELSDSGERDFAGHADVLESIARICAEAVAIGRTYGELAHRDKTLRELVDLSREVAQSHDIDHFVLHFAQRLLTSANADCVDVWRVSGGVIRSAISCTREGADPSILGSILDTSRYPSLEHTLLDHSPLVITRQDDPQLSAAEAALYREWGYASSLTMPLVAGGELVGLVDVYDDAERTWEDELEFLTSVCQLVAGVFDSNALLDETRQIAHLREELADLGAELASAGTPQELAERAAARLRTATGCADCDIWWLEEGYLRCLASVDENGVDTEVFGNILHTDYYPATEQAINQREILVIGSLDDPRVTDYEREDYLEWGFHSVASIPLVSNDQVVGLIDLYDHRERDYNDVRWFLPEAARTVGDALRNADLLEGLQRGNAALRELVEMGDRLNEAGTLEDLARDVAERLRTVLAAEDCDIWQVDGDKLRCLASVDSRGWDADEVGSERELARYESTVEALAVNQPMVVGDLEAADLDEAELQAYRRWHYRSMVSLPLVVDGRAIGLIDIFDVKVRDFTRNLDLIRNVGRLVAGSFEKAMLVERLERSSLRMALISESALELTSSLDLQETLRAAARRLCEAVSVPECEITVIDGDALSTLVHLRDGVVDEDALGDRMALADAAVTQQVIETKRPATVGSLRDPRLTPAVREMHKDDGCRSWVTLPLIIKDRVIGTVELVEPGAERTFTQAELDTAAAVCHAAALAIDNAAHFEREQRTARETQLLNDIAARTAATLDLEEVVQAAVQELGQLMPFEEYGLLLFDVETVDRVIGSRPEADSLVGRRLDEFDAAVIGRIVNDGVVILSLPDDLPPLAGSPAIEGMTSSVVIALPSETGLLGVLDLSSSDPDAFSGIDSDLLQRVGTQLSLAIKNAQLYDEIKHMHLGNLKALSSALNAKDYYTLGHAARVAAYTVMLGRQLGWEDDVLAPLEEAAYLHDIGKISISDRVLLKPGRLNPQEWEEMREHPVVSADIIRPLFPSDYVLAVRHHHERYDGTGYPDGLAGEGIPTLARAMAVVDAYDAMSCRRPYRAGLTYSECLAELHACRGTQFDPQMVDAFLLVLEDVAQRRSRARDIAVQAAERIRGEVHSEALALDDESSAAYLEVEGVLREVRDANPPTRFLTTHAQIDKKFVIGVDPEEDPAEKSRLGDEIFVDDEMQQVLAGKAPQINTVFADEFGVWVSGLAPIRDADGRIVAVAVADLPALASAEAGSSRGESRRTFAAMLQTAAVRLSRAEIDAITDALTGLYNHRYLHERLSEELHRARETEQPLSVLFCDLDHFKTYNDTNGHSAGDGALREVAHVIEQSVRNVDVAARYGGEEFAVLLVDTDREEALAVAERIRERLRAVGFSAKGTPLTVSIGVATYPDDADRRDDLLNKADWAMYLAKRRGRDQVASFLGE